VGQHIPPLEPSVRERGVALVARTRAQHVARTSDRTTAAIQYVRVEHGRAHIAVAKQFLNRANVVARLEQMRREAVPERVARDTLGQILGARGRRNGTLHGGLVKVIRIQRRVSRSRYVRVAGNTHCHFQSRAADGDLRQYEPGIITKPRPAAMSLRCSCRTRSRCGTSAFAATSDSIVRRSRPPLPPRTTIPRIATSTSFTRSVHASMRRRPLPYMRSATRRGIPSMASITRRTSSRVITVGRRRDRLARTISP